MDNKLVKENVFKATVQTILKIIKNRRIKTSQLDETDDLKVMTKDERDKLEKITSSGTGKNFLSDDFSYKPIEISVMSETSTQKIMTAQERDKIAKLNITGASDKFLSEDGSYKKVNADVIISGTNNKLYTKDEKDRVEKLSITGAPDEFLAKDGFYKKINADNVLDGTTNKVMTKTEREKIEKIITSGDGTKVLANDGTYKTPSAASVISDTKLDKDLAYSNVKVENIISDLTSNINSKLLQKSDITHTHAELEMAHEHKNKNVIDDITLAQFSKWNKLVEKINPEIIGTGTKILYDDLTFKEFSGSGGGSGGSSFDLFDRLDETQLKILQQADSLDPTTIHKILSLKYPVFVCTVEQYELLQARNQLEPNTVYFVIDPDADDSGNSGGSGSSGSSIIITSGDGTKVLANDGTYKKIIDDSLDASLEQTYSIDKIIDTIGKLITSANDSSVKIWQKQKLNVSAGDTFDALVTEPDILTKNPVVVQCYKFIEGDNDITEILKVFDNTDAENFVYNKDSIVFDDIDGMQIIDTYTLTSFLNEDGVYESELIDTAEFEALDRIEVI